MSEILETVAYQAVLLLAPVVASALVVLVGYGVKLLRSKVAEVDNKIVQEALEAALAESEAVVVDGIFATRQVYVDALKEQGKFDAEARRIAMQKAQEYFLTHVSDRSLAILEAAIGPVEQWLAEFIEAKIGEIGITTAKADARPLS